MWSGFGRDLVFVQVVLTTALEEETNYISKILMMDRSHGLNGQLLVEIGKRLKINIFDMRNIN